jgi:hypothetical protein
VWREKFEPSVDSQCIESAAKRSCSLPAYILNRHKAFACIRPGLLSCHSLVIPRLFCPRRMYMCMYMRPRMHKRLLACLGKKNKPPLIHVSLHWYAASKLGSRRLGDVLLFPSLPLSFLYTELLRLRLAGIKDAGFEIEHPTEDSFHGSFPCDAIHHVQWLERVFCA